MTKFDPYLLQATVTKMSPEEVRPTTFAEALKYGDEVNDGSRNMAELYAEL